MAGRQEMEKKEMRRHVVLIPAYEPGDVLVSYVGELRKAGFSHILVVDDGSGEAYQPVFAKLEGRAQVIHHECNKGKGAALKTGCRWIRENLPESTGIITADADGQHRPEDCAALSDALAEQDQEKVLLLGTRDFSLSQVPLRSRMGNRITTFSFALLYGKVVMDTQTGLRAFRSGLCGFMEGIPGDRFEYEMNVLVECAKSRIPMIPVPIETVYEENHSSHFNTIKDSYRVYKVLFGGFFRFTGSSIISTLIDQGLFNLLNLALFQNGSIKAAKYIFLSTVIARLVSASANFAMNRSFVFGKDNDGKKAFLKYALLCALIMLLSAGGTWAVSTMGLNSTVSKLIVDVLLYIMSYRVQSAWVFASGKTEGISDDP
ncbi:MAG: bifunctional glycosyltransferase family 2/GtrA family protein [Lachnospiraceae bacterium]|nr:bifunctional glycosyltransferase family 2/GtrA family protein [Lachnospiraceae bacterium]